MNRSIRYIFCGAIYLAVLLLCPLSGAGQPGSANKNYYALIAGVAAEPVKVQQEAIARYMESNPGDSRPFLYLLEMFRFEGMESEALDFFYHRLDEGGMDRNASWMLAKLFLAKENDATAEAYLRRALSFKNPEFALLEDAVKLELVLGKSLIESGQFPDIQQQAVMALRSFFKDGDYPLAAERFSSLRSRVPNSLPVLRMDATASLYALHNRQSREKLEQSAAMARHLGDTETAAQMIYLLAYYEHYYEQNLELAVALYDSSMRIARMINKYELVARASSKIGYYLSWSKGSNKASEPYFMDAIRLSEKLKEWGLLAESNRGLSMACYYQARYHESLNFSRAAEEAALNSREFGRLQRTLYDRVVVLTDLKQYELARITLERVAAYARDWGVSLNPYDQDIRFARVYLEMGHLATEAEEHYNANQFYSRVRSICRALIPGFRASDGQGKDLMSAYAYIGASFRYQNQLDSAQVYYRQAYETAKAGHRDTFIGWYLSAQALISCQQRDWVGARQKAKGVLAFALENQNSDLEWNSRFTIAETWLESGDLAAALQESRQAVTILEETAGEMKQDEVITAHFADAQSAYQQVMDILYQLYRNSGEAALLDSIYSYYERGRSQSLKASVGRRLGATNDAGFAKIKSELSALQRDKRLIAEGVLDRHFQVDENQLEALRMSLAHYRLFADGDSQNKIHEDKAPHISIKEFRQLLQEKAHSAVLYHISDRSNYALLVTPDTSVVIGLDVKPSELGAMVNELMYPFHEATEGSLENIEFRAGTAFALYESVVKPLEASGLLSPNILIIPDGPLQRMPFHLLLSGKPASEIYTPLDVPDYKNDFLVQRYNMSYAPSTQLLTRHATGKRIHPSVLILANAFNRPERIELHDAELRGGMYFAPLPFAEQEAAKIQETVEETRTFTQSDATQEKFDKYASQYSVVHFGVHAFADLEFDEFSGIVLACGDSTDDGFLMGYEISEMTLNNDLIVLNGCETGRGRLISGEGVLGLPRLFLGAGAQTVLLTHWKVYDRLSAALTPIFYQHLFREGVSKSVALARAQRDILADDNLTGRFHYQHPFFWAPYALYGDPGEAAARDWTAALFGALAALVAASLLLFWRRSAGSRRGQKEIA